ncbi:MAG TPA: c-type cytochrome [Actinomycetota bacterium]
MSAGRWPIALALALAGFLGAGAVGCSSTPSIESPPIVPGGNPSLGAALIAHYGCGSCHIIPGIPRADGLVGPPLIHFGRRQIIAGEIPNNADNLISWIVDPQAIEPKTAMPNLHVTQQQARDIAAYLLQLQ